jgi:hypothetical protein
MKPTLRFFRVSTLNHQETNDLPLGFAGLQEATNLPDLFENRILGRSKLIAGIVGFFNRSLPLGYQI